jgi:hypothetical protein
MSLKMMQIKLSAIARTIVGEEKSGFTVITIKIKLERPEE